MKNIVLIIAISLLIINNVSGQKNITYGVLYKWNSSTQLVSVPNKPEDGTFAWDRLGTLGAGLFIEKPLFEKIGCKISSGYLQKGFKEAYQTSGGNMHIGDYQNDIITETSTILNEINENILHYLFLDVVGKFSLSKPTLDPYIIAGIRSNYLLKSNLMTNYNMSGYGNVFDDGESFRKFNIGMVVGLGVEVNEILTIDGEFNLDLIPILSKENVSIKNQLFSLTLGINIDELFRKNV